MRENTFYQRGLNGRVVAKWIDPPGNRQRRWLSESEALALETDARHVMTMLWQDHKAGTIIFKPSLDKEAGELLERIRAYSMAASAGDVSTFHSIYKPVGILPPDQYQAVLLQATEGCSYNQCTFCDFYKDLPFHIKTESEFHAHCEAVHDYLGRGLSLRRTIFLGDANALVVPQERLLKLFNAVHAVFNVEELGGIFAFQDAFSGEKKDKSDYLQLRSKGLERVYIGLESGHDPLLKFLKKPGNAENGLHTIRALKSAGIGVGVIILLGAGGKTYAVGHILDTIRVLNEMSLDLNDQIYFSELVQNEGLSYTLPAYQAELDPLDDVERHSQAEQIELGLTFNASGGTPHISRYDIREFVY